MCPRHEQAGWSIAGVVLCGSVLSGLIILQKFPEMGVIHCVWSVDVTAAGEVLMHRLSCSVVVCLFACAPTSNARGAENPVRLADYLDQYCLTCHRDGGRKGGVRLDALKDPADPAAFAVWVRVYDQVASGAMPPKKAAQPGADERARFLDTLRDSLTAADRASIRADGRGTLRRLNRVEYENTLRDLLGLPALEVRAALPEDGQSHGFDKVASGLDVSHVQMAKYLRTADAALRRVLARPAAVPPSTVWRQPASHQDTARGAMAQHCAAPVVGRALARGLSTSIAGNPQKDAANAYRAATFTGAADSVVVLSGVIGAHQPQGIQPDRFRPPVPGWYRVTFSVWGARWERTHAGPAVRGTVRTFESHGPPLVRDADNRWQLTPLAEEKPKGGWKENVEFYGDAPVTHVVRASVRGTPVGFFDAPSLKPTEHTVRVWLDPGDRVSFHAMTLPAVGPVNHGTSNGVRDYEGPGIAYDWFQIEGPLPGDPGPEPPRLFGPAAGAGDDARGRLRAFAARAFRRPVEATEVEAYARIVDARVRAQAPFDEALLAGYAAILCSPDFLFVGLEPGEYRLASRLSYFLWNSPPDAELLARAASGRLATPAVLRAEVDRLLADPRSTRFVEHFLDEWLDLKKIDFTTPDPQLYPEFDPWLRDSMLAETRAYFRKLIADNRGVEHLVASDFLLVNQRLAELYGVPGVTGAAIRSVPVPAGSGRGGLLTQAAVLKVTSNGTATSPVLRGAWVAERLLGVARVPPPPNVPAVEPDATGAVTIRQMIEKHRADPSCAACHAKFDPPGLALEEFDVIGGRRDRYRLAGAPKKVRAGGVLGDEPVVEVVSGAAHRNRVKIRVGPGVDPSGELADGRKFANTDGLRKLLVADPDQLSRNFARHLTVYATGAAVRFSDRAEIEAIVRRAAQHGRGVKTLIHEVVASEAFRAPAGVPTP